MGDLNLSTIRKWKVGKESIGELYVNSSHFAYTLEDQVREIKGQPVATWKVQNETAIPEGKFEVRMTFSNRFQRIMPELIGVPGFAGVRIHGGNTDKDTDGCILCGQMKDGMGIHNCAHVLEQLSAMIQSTIDQGARVWMTVANQFEAGSTAGK